MSFSYEPKNFDHFFVLHKKNDIENDKYTCYKILFPSLLILPNILKKVENPQRLELRVGLRRCWGERSWNDTFTIASVACDRRFRAIAAWGTWGREKGKRLYKIPTFDCPGQLRLDPDYRGELLVLQYFFNINLLFFV